MGEMEAGETREISDETPAALKALLGFDPEKATAVGYTSNFSGEASNSVKQRLDTLDVDDKTNHADKNLIYNFPDKWTFNSTTGAVTWLGTILLEMPTESFNWQVLTGSISLADGEVAYCTLDRTGTTTNLTVSKVADGSLLLNRTNKNHYVLFYRKGDHVYLRDGRKITKTLYEESWKASSEFAAGDSVPLPGDSRTGGGAFTYKSGSGSIQFFVGGEKWNNEEIPVASSFDPSSYTSGTGFVEVPDSVDLSDVQREDIFKDNSGNEFSIVGSIDNTVGQKKFKIATGQTVDLDSGAIIFRQDYKDTDPVGSFVNSVVTRRRIPAGTQYTFRVEEHYARISS